MVVVLVIDVGWQGELEEADMFLEVGGCERVWAIGWRGNSQCCFILLMAAHSLQVVPCSQRVCHGEEDLEGKRGQNVGRVCCQG